MKTTPVISLLVAIASIVAVVANADAKVTITQPIGPSQAVHILGIAPVSSNGAKAFPNILKVALSITPASPCQLVLRLDPPGAVTGGGAFLAQVTPSSPSAAALVDTATLFSGSNLSVQNVTTGACTFTVDFD